MPSGAITSGIMLTRQEWAQEIHRVVPFAFVTPYEDQTCLDLTSSCSNGPLPERMGIKAIVMGIWEA